ncbi:uncharacterized G-patch domain protein DDB_G0278987-like [Neltuma alba]|uniref:uncharacterized G-patch domain protein DDB_G0278987-like n=1 Tax=Neltuma alba TaxID=207710 RepID=UPI0010A36487|nr:uncharacterized G-patch domain protein DDB_G0278987-like [Prosopis alba]
MRRLERSIMLEIMPPVLWKHRTQDTTDESHSKTEQSENKENNEFKDESNTHGTEEAHIDQHELVSNKTESEKTEKADSGNGNQALMESDGHKRDGEQADSTSTSSSENYVSNATNGESKDSPTNAADKQNVDSNSDKGAQDNVCHPVQVTTKMLARRYNKLPLVLHLNRRKMIPQKKDASSGNNADAVQSEKQNNVQSQTNETGGAQKESSVAGNQKEESTDSNSQDQVRSES